MKELIEKWKAEARYYRYLDNEEQVKTLEELYNIFICE